MWEITYRDRWSGRTVVKTHSHTESDARGWTESLARENNCKATCEYVPDQGGRRHILTVGHDPQGG